MRAASYACRSAGPSPGTFPSEAASSWLLSPRTFFHRNSCFAHAAGKERLFSEEMKIELPVPHNGTSMPNPHIRFLTLRGNLRISRPAADEPWRSGRGKDKSHSSDRDS